MKVIQSVGDLAINGALPAFDDKRHVGRPNIGSREQFHSYVDRIFDNCWLTNNGPLVREFEQRVADCHQVKNCVAMCNGTIALEIAIRALKMDGEVIVPAYTFIATAHALSWQSITPVFTDIDPVTYHLDPAAVRKKITPETTGIIGVHLWGRTAPVEELQGIADEFGLKLIFDAAHAFGCSHRGTMIGSFGDCEVLSFHATKFFNTFEGGAVLTNDDDLADVMRLMRNFGFSGMDNVIHPGTNGKMIEIAAAMGLVNLDAIDAVVEVNYKNYLSYREQLGSVPGVNVLSYDASERNNYQYVVIEIDEKSQVSRDEIVLALHAENILARRYFWPGCHNMMPYKELDPDAGKDLPETQKVADRVIVLPTGFGADDAVIATVSSVVRVLMLGED